MLEQRLRGLIAALTLGLSLGLSLGACPESPESTDEQSIGRSYLNDSSFRRRALLESLVSPDNRYSRMRIARYESGAADAWSRLDVWNPPTALFRVSELGATELDLSDTEGLTITEGARAGELEALRALGERAFRRYPAQLASPRVLEVLRDRSGAARYGLWVDPVTQNLGGLVRVRLRAMEGALAYTCASCHAVLGERGALVLGLANAGLNLGALAAEGSTSEDPEGRARLWRWGAGRVDVSTDDGSEPVAIPDLRPLRFQSHLHRAGAVAQRSLASLAVRLETLLITGHQQSVRPPREISLGLAVYLLSLADTLARSEVTTEEGARGRALFTARCASCHAPTGYSGGLMPAQTVGTDPSIARSADRGTGSYRVPSLRGVSQRAGLLHDGSIAGLSAMLDPARLRGDYSAGRRGPGAVVGHEFGLDLSAPDRRALQVFLSGL